MLKPCAVAAAMFMLASTPASASADLLAYAGVDVGNTSRYQSPNAYTSFGLFVGHHFNAHFALEAGYRQHGQSQQFKATQVALSLVGTSYVEGQFERFHVFGRVGYNRIKTDGCNCDNVTIGAYEGERLLGLGLGYAFAPHVVGRVEYQQAMKHMSNVSATVAIRF